MRILYISNSSGISGAPAILLNIVKGLCRNHDVGVVLPDSDGPLFRSLSELGIKCWSEEPYGLTIWPRVLNPFKYLRRIYGLTAGRKKAAEYVGRVIDEFKPDIVHTNVGPLDLALEECRRRNIPHVWHLREFQNGMRFWPSRKVFMDKIHSYGNYNIAITECVSDYWNLRDCDSVIYDGVVTDKVVSSSGDGKKRYFLSVGRVEKNKGQLELLKAYCRYRRNGGDAMLEIVGRISLLYGVRCKAYVLMHRLGPYVNFAGHRNDVAELMRNALALIVTSVTEGFGLASVEAMLQNCLVIGNDTTGMKEQFDVGRNFTGSEIGLRYKGLNRLAEAMAEVSGDSGELSSMRERALQTACEKYNVSLMLDGLEAFYSNIIGTSHES